MAEVKMSLEALDAMRDEIKDKDNKIQELNKELVTVKADKRTRQVTKSEMVTKEVSIDVRGKYEWSSSMGSPRQRIEKYQVEEYYRNAPQEKVEYINFEDVKEELKKKLTDEFAEEMGQLTTKAHEYHRELGALKEKYAKDLEEIEEAHVDTLKVVKKGYVEEVDKWQKKYEDLKEDRDTRTEIQKLEDRITELVVETNKLRNRNFFERLINTKG